jgi:hypothetical protein
MIESPTFYASTSTHVYPQLLHRSNNGLDEAEKQLETGNKEIDDEGRQCQEKVEQDMEDIGNRIHPVRNRTRTRSALALFY